MEGSSGHRFHDDLTALLESTESTVGNALSVTAPSMEFICVDL